MFTALFVLIVVYVFIGSCTWWIFSMLLEDFGSLSWEESGAYARIGAVTWPLAIPMVVVGGFGWAVYCCATQLAASFKTVVKHLTGVINRDAK